MPLPVYQRLLGCLLSTRTATTLLLPSVLTYWVRSYWNVVYPYGQVPSENVLRYQPTPPSMNPEPPPPGEFLSNPSAGLQSWGTVKLVQDASLKVGCSAPEASDRKSTRLNCSH